MATEVRSLAQRSAMPPAKSNSSSLTGVERVGQAPIRSTEQASPSKHCSTITQVASLWSHSSQTSVQHAQGISHVKQTVQKLDAATQSNMTLMTQSTQAAASMKSKPANC